jgi:hypothetical protein
MRRTTPTTDSVTPYPPIEGQAGCYERGTGALPKTLSWCGSQMHQSLANTEGGPGGIAAAARPIVWKVLVHL